MQWEIRYYDNESDYRRGSFKFKENFYGSRENAIRQAEHKIKYSSYQYYDLVQK